MNVRKDWRGRSIDEISPLLISLGGPYSTPSIFWALLLSVLLLCGCVGQLVFLPLYLLRLDNLDNGSPYFLLVLSTIFSFLVFGFIGLSLWILKRNIWANATFKSYWIYYISIGAFSGIAKVILFNVSYPSRTTPTLQVLFSGISTAFGLICVKLLARRAELECLSLKTSIGFLSILAGVGLGVYDGVSIYGDDIMKRTIWELLFIIAFILLSISHNLMWFYWDKYEKNEGSMHYFQHYWVMVTLLISVQISEIITYFMFFWVDILPTVGSSQDTVSFIGNFIVSAEYFFQGTDPHLTYDGILYICCLIISNLCFIGLQHPKYGMYRSVSEILIIPVAATVLLTLPRFDDYPKPILWQYIIALVLVFIGQVLLFKWRNDTFLKLFANDGTPFEESTSLSHIENTTSFISILSQYTFSWVTPIILLGYNRPLEVNDVWKPYFLQKTKVNGELFEKEWEKEMEKPNPSVGWAFFRAFGSLLILPTTLFAVNLVCATLGPGILMRDFLIFLESKDTDPTDGWILAFGVFFTQLIAASSLQNSFHSSIEMGVRVKQATMYAIYKKLMNLPSVSSTGEIINLSSNDSNRLLSICRMAQLGWVAIIQLLVVGALLIVELSWSGLIGFATLLLLVPFQVFISRKIAVVRRSTVRITDERVRTMSDILSAIQLIKFFSWEDSFTKKIEKIRANELEWLQRGKIFKSINDTTSIVGVVVTTFITLVSYVYLGNSLEASKAFTALSLLNLMRNCLGRVPRFSKTFAEMFITFERLKHLLIRPNLVDDRIIRDKRPNHNAYISVEDATFIVEENPKKAEQEDEENPLLNTQFTLKDIKFFFESGTLVAIVGSVGAGKTSLLNSLLGQMKKISGKVEIEGSIALASQEPWLINDTLKENILFGTPYNEKKYNSVLLNCELLDDLKQLPAGDQTEIGERGINLSGGQKQRVSLARAIYANRDIYLLDDPLSAVDRHVGNNLFHKCVSGMLKKKLVFFVTNQLQYLSKCDKILFLQDGKITGYGSFTELLDSHTTFRKLVKKYSNTEENESGKKPQVEKKDIIDTKGKKESGTLTSKEERNIGVVDFSVYKQYFNYGGYKLSLSVLILSILTGVSHAVSNWFISYWIDNVTKGSREFYVGLYFGVTFLYVVLAYSRGFLFAYTSLRSATRIHNTVFKVIMHAPMTYFYSTPTGRILNRFSSDQDKIDEEIPELLNPALLNTISSIITLVLIVAVLYWFVLPAILMLGVFVWIIRYFMASSRELRRLEAITVSPIFAHLSASLKGLPVIRAYDAQYRFENEYFVHLDKHHSILLIVETVARWVGIRLDAIATVMLAFTAFIIMASRDWITPASAGLAMAYSFQMTGAFQLAVRAFAETDSKMTSVERMLDCVSNTPQEAPHKIEESEPPPHWPQKGAITFNNVFMKYPISESPVLKDLSFTIYPKEKIGIVGRTGAGKSSIISSLFRIIEIYHGKIEIDGIDISQIGLQDLRTRLSIIPQDPTLFIGTIRSNLDPWEAFSEDQIYTALKKVKMDKVIADLPSGIETIITEGGKNFSLGQRQLLCIARSLLQNSKILVMDEATASIDVETDSIIQKTIRESFKEHTVITIAHRINTIIDCDRIMVIDYGQLVEFGSPSDLLSDPNSIFLRLVNENDDAQKLKSFVRENKL